MKITGLSRAQATRRIAQWGRSRRILPREYAVCGQVEFARPAEISASPIYNLRRSQTYGGHRVWGRHTPARPGG